MGVRGKRGAAAALAVIAAFALAWWAKPYVIHWIASTIVDAQLPVVGGKAPDFHLPDVNGVTRTLSGLKGKVVLVNFWATWCAPCSKEVPWFVEFQNEWRGRGFTVIGISMDEQSDDNVWGMIQAWAGPRKVNYPLVLGDSLTTQRYGGVETLPQTLLVDRAGIVRQIHVGLVPKETWHKEIAEVLDPAPQGP